MIFTAKNKAFKGKAFKGVGTVATENRKIARRLKNLRAKANLSPEETALLTGIPALQLKKYESGAEIPASFVRLLCTAYGVKSDAAFCDDDASVRSAKRKGAG